MQYPANNDVPGSPTVEKEGTQGEVEETGNSLKKSTSPGALITSPEPARPQRSTIPDRELGIYHHQSIDSIRAGQGQLLLDKGGCGVNYFYLVICLHSTVLFLVYSHCIIHHVSCTAHAQFTCPGQ